MAPVEVFAHIPTATVTSGGTTAPASGTVETWTVTALTAFPALVTGTTQYHVGDPQANSELILVTVSPGGTGAGQSWTVTRGADGTTPVVHTAGFTIYQVTPASWLGHALVPLFPSGDASGATDRANINAMLTAGDPVYLVPNSANAYVVDVPIVIKNQSFLTGFQWNMASQDDFYGAGIGQATGAIIQPATGFTGAAVISMPDPGSGVQNYGVDISGISIYGSTIGSGTGVHGISIIGAWAASFLRGVQIQKAPQDNLHMDVGATGKVPDDWQITDCKFSGARTGHGVNIVNNLPDSWFDNCESSENAGDGWHVNWCDNTRWSNCKGENNTGAGWNFTDISSQGIAMLTGCSSQLNNNDGFLFQASTSGGSYQLTGCRSIADNVSAGTFAAFRSNGSKARIIGTGCYGTGAAYGASEVSGSLGMWFTGSYFTGTTAALHDDGTNTNPLVNAFPAFGGTPVIGAVKTVTANYTATANDYVIFGNGTLTITIPAASAATGQVYYIFNSTGAGTVTISGTVGGIVNPTFSAQYGGLGFVSDGTSWQIIDNPLTTGTQGILGNKIFFGPVLFRGGLYALYNIQTANYSIASGDFTVLMNGASLTATLPDATADGGQIYTIKNLNASSCTVATTSSQTIDGAATYTLARYQSVMVQSDSSTDWHVLAVQPGGSGVYLPLAGGTMTGNETLAAGTASVSPLTYQSGTNLTTPAAGVREYDGVAMYATNETTSGRGLIPVEQRFRLTATGSNITTIANFFGTTSNISLVANAEYEIEIVCWFLKNTAGAVTWTFTNSAAPTSMTIDYQLSPSTGIVTTPGATDLFGEQYNVTTTAPTVVSASLTTGVNHRHKFRIRLINGTGTSLKIQATSGAGSLTPGINSYWTCHRVPAANVGTFSA